MKKLINCNKRSWQGFVTLLAIYFCSAVVHAQPTFLAGQDPKPADKIWTKVQQMSDEFNGSSLDLSKWQQDPVGNGWVWIGRPPGLFDPKAISVAEGQLRVTVSELPKPKTVNGKHFKYQGAVIRSLKPGQHGWYYEARMKANHTEMSSTFWLMSQNKDCRKKVELDIQENVGKTSSLTYGWAKNWHHIYHSNAIHRTTSCQKKPVQRQAQKLLETENWERFYVYGAWWKSPNEIRFYLDGKYAYTINPSTGFDVPMWIHMAIETYDWNPVPNDGGMVRAGTWDDRTTRYDWVRVWKLEDGKDTGNDNSGNNDPDNGNDGNNNSGGQITGDQCNITAQCKATFGQSATDCKNSASNNSICMCGNKRCDASQEDTDGNSNQGNDSGNNKPNPPDIAGDQCNFTTQCKTLFGSKATDCKNSASSNSVCMCGSQRCDASSSPSTPANPPTSSTKPMVVMKKANAQGFAIDGSNGGANGQRVYLWATDTRNINQNWKEISRGNGYYSYQKAKTNYCLDAGNGGANGQNISLFTCSNSNFNQQWKKVSLGGNKYRLEKRNAPAYSIDAGNGGKNLQYLFLWKNNNANANQHWIFVDGMK